MATRCDFSGDGTVCPSGESCQTGGGCPKYGDYNGNVCMLGRLNTVFASGADLTSVRSFFQSFVVCSTPTALTYTGDTTGDFHDDVTLSARLVLSGTAAPVAGQTITLSVGSQSCTGITNSSGTAACTLTLNQPSGSYTVSASFASAGLSRPAARPHRSPSPGRRTLSTTLPAFMGVVVPSGVVNRGRPNRVTCPRSSSSRRTRAMPRIRAIPARAR
jgi:hypothetical protein